MSKINHELTCIRLGQERAITLILTIANGACIGYSFMTVS